MKICYPFERDFIYLSLLPDPGKGEEGKHILFWFFYEIKGEAVPLPCISFQLQTPPQRPLQWRYVCLAVSLTPFMAT